MATASGDCVTNSGADLNRLWTFKSVVLGDKGVGKTWLVNNMLTGCGSDETKSKETEEAANTGGVTFHMAKMELGGGSTGILHVYDTSGKERFQELQANLMRDVGCAIIVFDPCHQSAEACCASLAEWHQLVRQYSDAQSVSELAVLFCLVAVFNCDATVQVAEGGNCKDIGGCRGRSCDHLRCLSAGQSFAEALRGQFFQCQRAGHVGRPRCEWLGGQELSPAWLGIELMRRQLCSFAKQPVRPKAKTADKEDKVTQLRLRKSKSCCQQLVEQLNALLNLPAMVAVFLASRPPTSQK